MDWFDVPLDPDPELLINFGLTIGFGRSTAKPVPSEGEELWRIQGSWEVTYRMLIDRRNVSRSEYFREHALIDAIRFFEEMHARSITDDELLQLQHATSLFSDALNVRIVSTDKVYGHELMHVLAVEACIAYDSARGQLASLAKLAKTSMFPDQLRAQAFANEWETRVMIRLRTLYRRGGSHRAVAYAALGGVAGSISSSLGIHLQPPASTGVLGYRAPPPTGDADAWQRQKLDLALQGYFDLDPSPLTP